MENASKALLIAGSVLIVIILIAFGLKILNSTKGTEESVKETMDATAMATFNNKFAGYMGNSVPASKVKSLVNLVISSNATSSHKISVTISGTSYDYTNPSGLMEAVSSISGKYKVTPSAPNGLLTSITITQ